MEFFESSSDLQIYLKNKRKAGKSIGFVPTMGALHQGHLSLIESSVKDNNITVASIFVNPLQFNNKKDLELYPRTLKKDLEMLKEAGCNVVFSPSSEEIYKNIPKIKMQFGYLEEVMEGQFRPGHFNGVAIIVSKLFHFVGPDIAYFGQKDLQQYTIIKQMVKDLSFPLSLRCCPIYRESDGLAMSSRNIRISKSNREIAAKIYESLQLAKNALLDSKDVEKSKRLAIDFLAQYPALNLEYLEIVNSETLEPINNVQQHKEISLCIAVFLDEVRLIDNVFLY